MLFVYLFTVVLFFLLIDDSFGLFKLWVWWVVCGLLLICLFVLSLIVGWLLVLLFCVFGWYFG